MQERIEVVRPHDNWNRAACRKRGFNGDFSPGGHDHVHVGAHQLGRIGVQPAGLLPRGAEFDDQIAAIDETTLAQFVPERRIAEPHNSLRPRRADGKAAKEPDAINAPGLLRARRKRPPCRRAANEREERAALHSITSSARASTVVGMSRSRALAVLRLITSSYFVGFCTGISAGFSPLRMRST